MAPVYLDSVKLYAMIGSPLAWTDISSEMVGTIKNEWGISGVGPNDRIADTGVLTFILLNLTGKYTPGHANTVAGWRKGTEIRLDLTFQNITYSRFYGKVETMQIDSGPYGTRTVTVSAVDWMDHAAEFPLDDLTLLQNVNAKATIENIINKMGRVPSSMEIDPGTITYGSVFDTLDSDTKAYSELAKIAKSEDGYIYIRKTRTTPEHLVFKDKNYRVGWRPTVILPLGGSESGLLLKEDGDQLLLEIGDGTLLNQSTEQVVSVNPYIYTSSAAFYNDMMRLDNVYGENLINRVKVEVYPKRQDTSLQVLFSLYSSLEVQNTLLQFSFEAGYTDPTGGDTKVVGINMVTPVATTDYQMFANPDGTGTDLTAYLSVTAEYKADRVIYTLQNTGTVVGYVTKLQARGYGIYSYNPLQAVSENMTSQDDHGVYELTFEQKYQTDPLQAKALSLQLLDAGQKPETTITGLVVNANRSDSMMEKCLTLDIGDKISVYEGQTGTNANVWIHAIKMTLDPGGKLNFEYLVKKSHSWAEVAIEPRVDPPDATKAGINYGVLPYLGNLKRMTIAGWVKAMDGSPAGYRHVISRMAFESGWTVNWNRDSGTGKGILIFALQKVNGDRHWYSDPAGSAFYDIWNHLTIAVDFSTNPNNPPTMWVNGVQRTVNLDPFYQADGTIAADMAAPLILANGMWVDGFFGQLYPGHLVQWRIYDRVLTHAEVTSLCPGPYPYEGPEIAITDGMRFLGPAIRAGRLADLDDGAVLTEDDLFTDAVYGATGIPFEPGAIVINTNVTYP